MGLLDTEVLRRMTAQQNIDLNIEILRLAGVESSVLVILKREVMEHARLLGVPF